MAASTLLSIEGISGQFLYEDKFIENLSALAFFCVPIISLFLIYRGTHRRRLCLLLAVVGLAGFLDEIGFGLRWLDPTAIHEIHGVPLDGIHDLFTIAINWFSADASVLEFSVAGLSIIIVGYVAVKWGHQLIFRTVHQIRPEPEIWFFFVAIVCVTTALVLDLDFFEARSIKRRIFQVMEEMLEFHAGLALMFSCVSIYLKDRKTRNA